MNKQIQQEEFEQSKVRLLYAVTQIVIITGGMVLWANNLQVIAMFVGFFAAYLHTGYWQRMQDKLYERMLHIQFMTQVDNLYITSYDDANDTQAYSTYNKAVDWLVKTGNQHRVTVYLIMYRDVIIRSCMVEKDGTIKQLQNQWRKPHKGQAGAEIITTETWEEYKDWLKVFIEKDMDARVRELRANKHAYEWGNEHLFNQAV